MNYGEIIKKAWSTMWNNKILWLFGLVSSIPSFHSLIKVFITPVTPVYTETTNVVELYLKIFVGQYGLDLTGFTLWISALLLFVLGIILYGALILGVIGITRGVVWERKREPLSFVPLFNESLQYFWRYVGMAIVAFIFGIILGVILFIPAGLVSIAGQTLGVLSICIICLFVPVGIAFSAWLGQAMIIMVVTDRTIKESFVEAWDFIFRKHLGEYVVLMLIAIGLSLGTLIIISVPGIAVMLIAAPSSFLQSGSAVQSLGFVGKIFTLLARLLYWLLYGPVIVFLNAIWIHAYLDLKIADYREYRSQQDAAVAFEGEVEVEIDEPDGEAE